jgi:meso-butanediol dehydrogenase / (S,S)-butanediol dehydrogenase / diacetyl reductase
VTAHAGRRCLVTGGASGIGAAMVRRFAAEGARVAVLDVAADGCRADGVELVITADVAVHGQVQDALRTVESRWGGVDVVLNNAGVSERARCLDVTPEGWNRIIGVNLTGAFFVAQAAARLMRRTGAGGVVINTASVSGMVGMPNYVAYNVSKAGLIELTKTMALELAPEIRVNAICPGYVLTDMQRREHGEEGIARCAAGLPLRRLGTPEEVAALASFLASDEAAFATGQSFVIDGGETAGGLASA